MLCLLFPGMSAILFLCFLPSMGVATQHTATFQDFSRWEVPQRQSFSSLGLETWFVRKLLVLHLRMTRKMPQNHFQCNSIK